MNGIKNVNLLDDDMLEGVSGGASGADYTDKQLQSAGVNVSYAGGSKVYTVIFNNGQTVKITPNIANDMYDCYRIGGGRKLTDQQIRDLIAQS